MAKVTPLKYYRRLDLVNLADVLDIKIEEHDKIAIIIEKILSSDNYDEQFALTQVDYIVKDRGDQLLGEKRKESLEMEREEKQRET